MKKIPVPLLALALLFVGGCQSNPLAGSYVGQQGTLTLKGDNTFFTIATGQTKPLQEGKWSANGNKLTLKLESISGTPIDEFIEGMAKRVSAADRAKVEAAIRNISGVVSDDKKSLTITTPAVATIPAKTDTFVRSDPNSS
jgi:hypothetical protein